MHKTTASLQLVSFRQYIAAGIFLKTLCPVMRIEATHYSSVFWLWCWTIGQCLCVLWRSWLWCWLWQASKDRHSLEHQLKQCAQQEAKTEELESEIEQQKRQTPTISDLESQLRNEKLRSQALEDKFWKAKDKLEDGEERWQKERAYLEETKRDLQQRIRRLQQPDADDTIACFQHQKPAPAARPPGSGGLPPEKKINFALKLGNSEQVLVLLSYITA